MGIDKLLVKTAMFNSPKSNGARMINTKYYQRSPLNPRIEVHQFVDKNGVNSEYVSKSFDNGNKYELFRLPDEVIKIVKNRFGEIKSFKSSIEQHNENPTRTYEKAKEAFANKTRSFLG